MDAAPASDKAVMEDPHWQRVFVEDITEAFRPGAEGWADEAMALNMEWDFDVADLRCSVTWWHGEHDAERPHRRCPTFARANGRRGLARLVGRPATSNPSIGTTRSSKSSLTR